MQTALKTRSIPTPCTEDEQKFWDSVYAAAIFHCIDHGSAASAASRALILRRIWCPATAPVKKEDGIRLVAVTDED